MPFRSRWHPALCQSDDKPDDAVDTHPANVFQYESDDNGGTSVSSVISDIDDDLVDDIHSEIQEILEFKVQYDTGETEWYPLSLVKDEEFDL